MIIAAQKNTWFGVFEKICILGSRGRLLQAVLHSEQEAKEWLDNRLKQYSWENPNNYMIEEVDVWMKEYKC